MQDSSILLFTDLRPNTQAKIWVLEIPRWFLEKFVTRFFTLQMTQNQNNFPTHFREIFGKNLMKTSNDRIVGIIRFALQ